MRRGVTPILTFWAGTCLGAIGTAGVERDMGATVAATLSPTSTGMWLRGRVTGR